MNKKSFQTLQAVLFYVILLAIIWVFRDNVLWGIIVFVFYITAWKAYHMREAIHFTMQNIETMVWGRPLDKDAWEKGEMKNHKVKVRWRKKDDKKTSDK